VRRLAVLHQTVDHPTLDDDDVGALAALNALAQLAHRGEPDRELVAVRALELGTELVEHLLHCLHAHYAELGRTGQATEGPECRRGETGREHPDGISHDSSRTQIGTHRQTTALQFVFRLQSGVAVAASPDGRRIAPTASGKSIPL
jgi:hypothetical protein